MKKIYTIMTAAIAASALLVSSCSTDGEAPVVQLSANSFTSAGPITGTVVADGGLKSVWVEKKRENSTQYDEDTSIIKKSGRFNIQNGAGYASDPVSLDAGSETNYTIKIETGKKIKGGFLGNLPLIGSLFSSGDYTTKSYFPAGEYRLMVESKNGKVDAAFTITSTGTEPGDGDGDGNGTPSNAQILAGLTQCNAVWDNTNVVGMSLGAKDSITATGDYFFKQGTTYGVLRVKTLTTTSAQLTLLKLNVVSATEQRLDSISTGTVGTGNEPSYFTPDGTVKSSTQMNANGSDVFVAIKNTGSVVITTSGIRGSFKTEASLPVVFVSVATVLTSMQTTGQTGCPTASGS